jgi:hypothetical protein
MTCKFASQYLHVRNSLLLHHQTATMEKQRRNEDIKSEEMHMVSYLDMRWIRKSRSRRVEIDGVHVHGITYREDSFIISK